MRHEHGKRKRRAWRKLHIGVSNGLIVAKWLSEYRKTDGEIAPNLIHQVGRIDSITADKAYDQSRVYEASNDHMNEAGQINIHPRANAVVSASDEAALRQRNQHIPSSEKCFIQRWVRKTESNMTQLVIAKFNAFYCVSNESVNQIWFVLFQSRF